MFTVDRKNQRRPPTYDMTCTCWRGRAHPTSQNHGERSRIRAESWADFEAHEHNVFGFLFENQPLGPFLLFWPERCHKNLQGGLDVLWFLYADQCFCDCVCVFIIWNWGFVTPFSHKPYVLHTNWDTLGPMNHGEYHPLRWGIQPWKYPPFSVTPRRSCCWSHGNIHQKLEFHLYPNQSH